MIFTTVSNSFLVCIYGTPHLAYKFHERSYQGNLAKYSAPSLMSKLRWTLYGYTSNVQVNMYIKDMYDINSLYVVIKSKSNHLRKEVT